MNAIRPQDWPRMSWHARQRLLERRRAVIREEASRPRRPVPPPGRPAPPPWVLPALVVALAEELVPAGKCGTVNGFTRHQFEGSAACGHCLHAEDRARALRQSREH